MKKSINFILASFVALSLYGQGSYQIEKDIFYRGTNNEELDRYMKERCKLDIYYPKDSNNFTTIVWIHGGGLQNGNKHFREEFMDKGMAIVAMNYRLYPKVKSPAYIDDAAAALAWVFNNIEKYGGDPKKIFVTGHSAGGYLVSMVGLDKSYLNKYKVDANAVRAYLPMSGQAITHSTVRKEQGLGRTQPIINELAPIHHVRPDAPPFVLITGGSKEDMPCRYEENLYFKKMMEYAGHKNTFLYELQGLGHGPMVGPACSIVLKHIKEILKSDNNGVE